MTKNVNILLINFLRAFITSNIVVNSFRANEADFTRKRKLPFWTTTVLILTSWKKSIPNRLNIFFTRLDLVAGMPEASAFCQARKKYSIQINQFKDGTVQALSSFYYDVLNGVCINAVIDDKKSEKSFIFNDHVKKFTKEAIIIYDRLYADYSVISFHAKGGYDYVIRCSLTSSFKEVSDFVKSDCFDKIVTLKVTERQKKFVKENGLPEFVMVRLVKVILSNGTIEVLITSLLDGKTYKLEDFQWLYHKRWCIETYFSRLKNLLEIERFSTKTVIGIEQDFHSLVFLSTLESVLIKEDEEKLCKENSDKKLKYEYKINKSVSYTAIADHIVDLLLNHDVPPSEVLAKLSRLFKNGSSPQRHGRQFKRKESTSTQKLRYHKYEKRVCA
jgi:hypothetical protein